MPQYIVHIPPAAEKDAALPAVLVFHNGGHTWPGHEPAKRRIGSVTMDIDANEMMWAFFQRHQLPEK